MLRLRTLAVTAARSTALPLQRGTQTLPRLGFRQISSAGTNPQMGNVTSEVPSTPNSTEPYVFDALGTPLEIKPIVKDNAFETAPIPPKVKGWPTPWIGPRDFGFYMKPLYTRGWGIMFKPRTATEPRTLCLSGLYRLSGWDDSAEFLEKVNELCRKEQHHPVKFDITYPGNYANVKFTIQTHSAVRLSSLINSESGKDLNLPGITLRDVRLAGLIHQLWSTSYSPLAKQSKAPEDAETKTADSTQTSPTPSPKSSEQNPSPSESVSNSKDYHGPWSPPSMRPTWSQLVFAMSRCDGSSPGTKFDWAIAKTQSKEERERAKLNKKASGVF